MVAKEWLCQLLFPDCFPGLLHLRLPLPPFQAHESSPLREFGSPRGYRSHWDKWATTLPISEGGGWHSQAARHHFVPCLSESSGTSVDSATL